MPAKPRSIFNAYLLCAIAIIIAFGCNTPSPKPALSPTAAYSTSTQKAAPPTKAIQTDIPPTQPPKPTDTSQPESPNVSSTREEKYYQITGNTEQELRGQLDKLGPLDKELGKRFDARTDWFIKWHYYYIESSSECKIDQTRVDVSLDITFTYPQWNPSSDASQALADKWNTYTKNLAIHEEGHASLADEGAQSIYETIMDMPSSPTCDELGKATNAAAQAKIDEIKQQEKDYDEETGHGETQGAVFP